MAAKTYLIQLIDSSKPPLLDVVFVAKLAVEKNIYLEHGRLTQAVRNKIPIEYTSMVCQNPEKYTLNFSWRKEDGTFDVPHILKGTQIIRNDFAESLNDQFIFN